MQRALPDDLGPGELVEDADDAVEQHVGAGSEDANRGRLPGLGRMWYERQRRHFPDEVVALVDRAEELDRGMSRSVAVLETVHHHGFFFFKQKTAYEIST